MCILLFSKIGLFVNKSHGECSQTSEVAFESLAVGLRTAYPLVKKTGPGARHRLLPHPPLARHIPRWAVENVGHCTIEQTWPQGLERLLISYYKHPTPSSSLQRMPLLRSTSALSKTKSITYNPFPRRIHHKCRIKRERTTTTCQCRNYQLPQIRQQFYPT